MANDFSAVYKKDEYKQYRMYEHEHNIIKFTFVHRSGTNFSADLVYDLKEQYDLQTK